MHVSFRDLKVVSELVGIW